MGAVKTYGSCKEKELCVSLYVVHAGTWMSEYKFIIKNENAAFSIFFLQAARNCPSESFPVAGHISYLQTTSNLRGTGPRSAIA